MYITRDAKCICNANYINDNPYLHEIAYPCDELIAPIIQLLNSKGYITTACCAGHWTNGDVENYVEAVYDQEQPIIESREPRLEIPYIAFESGCHPEIKALPDGWYWEVDHFYQLPSVNKVFERTVYENDVPVRKFSQYWETCSGRAHEWSYVIRTDMNAFNVQYYNEYGIPVAYDNPYVFYESLVKHMSDLYAWASLLSR